MEFKRKYVGLAFGLVSIALVFSCTPEPQTAEEDHFTEYEQWLVRETERADEMDREEWERTRARHEQWVRELEPRREEWPQDRQRRFDEHRQRFADLDSRMTDRFNQ